MHTTASIAKLRQCSTRTVRRNAVLLGIGSKLGHIHVFTDREKDILIKAIHDGPGNPEIKDGKKLRRKKS